jgi:hypothetical protein
MIKLYGIHIKEIPIILLNNIYVCAVYVLFIVFNLI